MSMKVIPPVTITTAMLTSSTVAEAPPAVYAAGTTYAVGNQVSVAGAAGLFYVYQSLQAGNIGHTPSSSPTWWQLMSTTYQVWSSGSTYAIGDRVIDASTHRVYESLVASNLNNVVTNVLKWFDVGPTNRYAMFDLLRNTASVQASPITIVITAGQRIDALALLGLAATSVTITMTNGVDLVYSYTEDLNQRHVLSWYDYFYAPFANKATITLFDLPPYSGGVLTIIITNTTGNVECGACVIGQQVDLGEVEYQAASDVLNFSSVDRDVAGNATMTQRRNVPKTTQTVWCEKPRVNAARAAREALNATPAVWVGIPDSADDYAETLQILGFYRRFAISLDYPKLALISLELEEV